MEKKESDERSRKMIGTFCESGGLDVEEADERGGLPSNPLNRLGPLRKETVQIQSISHSLFCFGNEPVLIDEVEGEISMGFD